MSRKRRVTTIQDFNNMASSQRKTTPGYETRQEFFAREKREENERRERAEAAAKAEADRPILEAQGKFNRALQELNRRVRSFWSKPLQVIADAGSDVAIVDTIGEYPERTGGRDQKKEFEIFKAVKDELILQGITLSDAGWDRLGSFVSVLAEHRGIEVSPGVWRQSLERLHSLGCFASGEVTGYRPPEPIQSVPQALEPELSPFAQQQQRDAALSKVLEENSIESRTGNAVIRAAIEKDWSQSIRDGFREFEYECQRLLFEPFTTEEITAMARVLTARNLLGTPKGWHTARVLSVRNHSIRPVFLSPDEALSWSLDKDEIPLNTFQQRRDFQRKVAAIHGGIPQLS